MKCLRSYTLSALIAFALMMPACLAANPFPLPFLTQWIQYLPDSQTVLVPKGLDIPLALHSELDSAQIIGGRKQLLLVIEDVVVDDNILFAAGAMAVSTIRTIEKNAAGQILSIGLELASVQATDGSKVPLRPILVSIKTTPVQGSGTRMRVDAHVEASVRAVAKVKV